MVYVAARQSKIWYEGKAPMTPKDRQIRLLESGGAPAGVWTCTGVALAYRAAQQAGATPPRLRVLLYDGAVRLCRQALAALDEGDADLAGDRLAKAQQSVRQLHGSIPPDAGARDGRLFERLYEQVHRRLVEANFYRRRESVSETIALLDMRRFAWSRLADAQRQSAAPAASGGCSKSWIG